MRCEEARQAIADARYGGGVTSAELDAHLAGCAECRAVQAREGALDRWLALDEPAAAGPQFDARFFAALAHEKARTRRRRALRFAWMLVPAAAAAAGALIWWQRAPAMPAELPPDELAPALDLELVEEIEVVEKLEELEAYEVLSQIDEDELDRILREEAP